MKTAIRQLGRVSFPEFTGERVYMHEFTKKGGLPKHLQRWQDTVDAMLEGVTAEGPIFLMVDQAPVQACATHRRPGMHIDGIWEPGISAHQPAPSHRTSPPPTHRTLPRHVTPTRLPQHFTSPPMHLMRDEDELLILASDVLGCAAYEGEWHDTPGVGGDCSHFDRHGLHRVDMEPGIAWAGDAMSMLHESIPVDRNCLRTVVRLNVKGKK